MTGRWSCFVVLLGVLMGLNCVGNGESEPTDSSNRSVSAPGLIAAYSFDEGSGSIAADASGNGHTGTLGSNAGSSPVWSSAGKHAGALSFNGTQKSWVTVPDSAALDLTNAMTVEAWVKPTALSH